MGEAEDVVFARQRQESAISDEAMQEFLRIKASIEALIPQALANLRRHNYPFNPLDRIIRLNGEEKVGWYLWSDAEVSYIFLLSNGVLILQRGGTSIYTPQPRGVGFVFGVNQVVKKVEESLRRLATTDFKPLPTREDLT
jgi:hypothetical protein